MQEDRNGSRNWALPRLSDLEASGGGRQSRACQAEAAGSGLFRGEGGQCLRSRQNLYGVGRRVRCDDADGSNRASETRSTDSPSEPWFTIESNMDRSRSRRSRCTVLGRTIARADRREVQYQSIADQSPSPRTWSRFSVLGYSGRHLRSRRVSDGQVRSQRSGEHPVLVHAHEQSLRSSAPTRDGATPWTPASSFRDRAPHQRGPNGQQDREPATTTGEAWQAHSVPVSVLWLNGCSGSSTSAGVS